MAMTWAVFIEGLRKRPGMYLGKKSVSLFSAFLSGFRYAEEIHDQHWKNMDDGGFDWAQFEQYVFKKYNPRRLSVNSPGLAFILSGEKEEEGLDLWFKWYDEFRSQ